MKNNITGERMSEMITYEERRADAKQRMEGEARGAQRRCSRDIGLHYATVSAVLGGLTIRPGALKAIEEWLDQEAEHDNH